MNLRLFLLLALLPNLLLGQDDKPKNWVLSGYVKDLQSLTIFSDNSSFLPGQLFRDNLIHNRLNFKWFINDELTFRAEMRNRFFWGDQVQVLERLGGLFKTNLDAANDYGDLSYEVASKKGVAFQAMLDRLFLDFTKNKWELRFGRQRVNWGINTLWNPNDIFNAFSFVDFDYEERPGVDALRVKYYAGTASSIEIAAKAKMLDNSDEAVIAGLWKFNRWDYDFQLLAGLVKRDVAFGGGWAGNLKNASFKGELTYFVSLEDEIDNSFAATFGFDYVFSNSLSFSSGFLFNSNGRATNSSEVFTFELTAKNLYPYKYTFYVQGLYPVHLLMNAGLAIIYSPSSLHALFINPTFTYSISDNWDLDFIGQLVFNKDKGYKSPVQAVFLRMKFSF